MKYQNRTMGRIFMYILMSFCHLSIVLTALTNENCSTCTHHLTIKMNNVTKIVDEKFLSIGLDTAVLCEKETWEGFNISSPRLLTLSKALSPSFLRFGGTTQDYVIFNDSYAELQEPALQGYHCPNNTPLTVKDWLKVNEYANKVGWDLLYGLNALLRSGSHWNPSNAIELIEFNEKLGYHLGWELGNELNAHQQLEGAQLGRDFVKLRKILDSYHHKKPILLVGPDVTSKMFYGFLAEFLQEAKQVIDAITFHHYYFDGRTATLEDFLNPDNFEALQSVIEEVFRAVKKAKATQKVWLGETSIAWGGGAPGLSDRYVAGFLWMDKLGLSAVKGIHVVIKESIYRGHYALLTDDLYPVPNYWLSLLYKRLVGRIVLEPSLYPPDQRLRVYVHCVNRKGLYKTSRGITVYLLNLYNSTQKIYVRALPDSKVHQYLLTPAGKMGLKSMNISLNGQELKMNGNNLPDISPKILSPKSPIVMPPFTYGFFVFPDGIIPACSKELKKTR